MSKHNMIPGNSRDIVASNVKGLCNCGMSEKQATHLALKHASKGRNSGKRVASRVKNFDNSSFRAGNSGY